MRAFRLEMVSTVVDSQGFGLFLFFYLFPSRQLVANSVEDKQIQAYSRALNKTPEEIQRFMSSKFVGFLLLAFPLALV